MPFEIQKGNHTLEKLKIEAEGGAPLMTSGHIGNLNAQRLALMQYFGPHLHTLLGEYTLASDRSYPTDRIRVRGCEIIVSNDSGLIAPAARWAEEPYQVILGNQLRRELQQKWLDALTGAFSDSLRSFLPQPADSLDPKLGLSFNISNNQPGGIVRDSQTPAQNAVNKARAVLPNAHIETDSQYFLGWDKLDTVIKILAVQDPDMFSQWVQDGIKYPMSVAKSRFGIDPVGFPKQTIDLMTYLSALVNDSTSPLDLSKVTGPLINDETMIALTVGKRLDNDEQGKKRATVHHFSGTSMLHYLLEDTDSLTRRQEINSVWNALAGHLDLPRDLIFYLHPTNHLKHFFVPAWGTETVDNLIISFKMWNKMSRAQAERRSTLRDRIFKDSQAEGLKLWVEKEKADLNFDTTRLLDNPTITDEALLKAIMPKVLAFDEPYASNQARLSNIDRDTANLLGLPAGQAFLSGFVTSQFDYGIENSNWRLHPFAIHESPEELDFAIGWFMKKRGIRKQDNSNLPLIH